MSRRISPLGSILSEDRTSLLGERPEADPEFPPEVPRKADGTRPA